jgi:DNA-binding CsgD family transcriptional regulator
LQYLNAIEKFYEAAANPILWPEALATLSTDAGCRGALLTTPVFIPGGLVHTHSLREAVGQFFEQGWYRDDLRNSAVRNHHWKNGFFSDHSLFTEGQMAKSHYYEKFARAADVPWFAAGRLMGDLSSDAVAISLQRNTREGEFLPHELASLNALLPRLQPSMALASSLAEINGKSLIDGLQLVRQASVLLRLSGSVAYMNPAAEACLGERLFLRRQRLVASNAREDSKLQGLISQACRAGIGAMSEAQDLRPVVLQPSETKGQMIVAAAPLRRTGADVVGFSGAILMITDLSSNVKLPGDVLQSVFGLTKREADIMALLGQGVTVQQVGDVLGSAKETVRHHMKALFQKTGATRQSELVAICLKMDAVGVTSGLR